MGRIDATMSPACECRARAARSILTGLRRSLGAGDRGSNGKRSRREYRTHHEGRGHFDLPGGVTLWDRRARSCEVTATRVSQGVNQFTKLVRREPDSEPVGVRKPLTRCKPATEHTESHDSQTGPSGAKRTLNRGLG